MSRVYIILVGIGLDNIERKIFRDYDIGVDEIRFLDVITMRKESVWEEVKSVEVVEVSYV